MLRKIIRIDPDKCNGCGACATSCHEGAIGMVDGKAGGKVATLLRDDYCDGLGDCLPTCLTGAISFEEREAVPYDEAAVKANRSAKRPATGESHLAQWPVQIKLAPVNAPYFNGARLLVAADCTAYAYAGFHEKFMKNHITLIGCPKLDAGDYADKLTEILRQNDIKSLTVARMEVPCCGGLENAVQRALTASGKTIPWQVVTLSTDGRILEN